MVLQLVLQSFNMTITTFVGQNIGARKTERVKQGIFIAWVMCSAIILAGSVWMNREGALLVSLFTDDAAVITNGAAMLKMFSYAYWSLPVVQILSGALRGAGKSSIPMFFMLSCFVVIRQIYLAITVPMTHNLLVVIAGWPLTWVLCAAGMTVYFFPRRLDEECGKAGSGIIVLVTVQYLHSYRFSIKFHKSGIQSPFLTKTRNELMTVEDGLYMSGADRHSGKRGSYE
ncbi:MAG: MATE family efflux transporter [Clostridium sp.]